MLSGSSELLSPIIELRRKGEHQIAKNQLVDLALQYPQDPNVQYETACIHDFLGYEKTAIGYYLAAIHNGLSGEPLRGAYLGLGSTYRVLGEYEEAKKVFLEALLHFPQATEIKVFLAMVYYNLAAHHDAVQLLLQVILSTTNDVEILKYKAAIDFYAADLNKIWNQ